MLKAIVTIAALLASTSAFAQVTTYSPNGTGGYNINTNDQYQGNIQPNTTGGYNYNPPVSPPPIAGTFGPGPGQYDYLNRGRR
jgi:hypothetical protein